MRRAVASLGSQEYDLVVIGGGIFGVCAAWDAASRGLSVALIERGDFCHATSANCFKMVHGGVRYLQHGDLYRVRESSGERRALLRIAPHLVSPLPIVVPTYGRGMRSREVLRAGMALYDALTADRNRGIADPGQRIPPAQAISRQGCLRLFPGLEDEDLTGAVVFYDGQMYSPPRLALAVLKSAVAAGADAANYLEATNFLWQGQRVVGVGARDTLTGDRLQIRARLVLNATGPWAERLLRAAMDSSNCPGLTFSRDAALVINRPLTQHHALAVQSRTRDPDAILSRGARHLFMVPWEDRTLIGVWHVVFQGKPEEVALSAHEAQGFLDEFNGCYRLDPPLTIDDVSMCNAGLVLFGDQQSDAINLSYGKRSLVLDHAEADGIEGLVTVVGVRYTTARGVGEKAVNLIFKKLGRKAPPCATAETPVHGGDIEDFQRFAAQGLKTRPAGLAPEAMRRLLRNHGSSYRRVLAYSDELPHLMAAAGKSGVILAEIVHAVREEMAQKLADVVFRRTDLGTGGHPGDETLAACCHVMAEELGWDEKRKRQELAEVVKLFPQPYARRSDALMFRGAVSTAGWSEQIWQ